MTKRITDWTDHIGKSALPADEFTFTDGSNYGLDGFNFATPPNEGVEQSARLPEVRGLSGLPDGIVEAGNEDTEDFFLEEATEQGGTGLYLDGVLEDGSMPSVTESAGGTFLGDMLSEDEGALPLTAAQKQAASLADLKWLDPTQEQDPDRLPKELLPDRPPLNRSPELEEAWGVNRRTDGITVIPNTTDLEIARHEKSIRDTPESGLPQPSSKTAQEVKDAILWAVRQSHYGTNMQDIKQGLVTSLGKDARRTVKAVNIIERDHGLAGKVFVRASAFPGLKNGKWAKELRVLARTARYVITDDDAVGKKLGMIPVTEVPWKQALGYYREWLGLAGFRVAHKGDPKNILRDAFLQGPKNRESEPVLKPVVKTVVASADQAAEELTKAAAKAKESEKPVKDYREQELKKTAFSHLAGLVQSGHISLVDAQKIRRTAHTPEDVYKATNKLLYDGQVTKAATYEGHANQAAPVNRPMPKSFDAQMKRVALLAKQSGQKVSEMLGILNWTRRLMNEGVAGKELDQTLQARFAAPGLNATAPLIKEIRKAHEGLAGFLYVDAEAYASPEGTGGCQKGALRHRANNIKYVLAMSRCKTCALTNADGYCQKYSKRLVDAPPVKNAADYQRRSIASANAPDHEVTASLFRPNESNLRSPLEDEMSLESSTSASTLSDVLFGGTEL